MFDPGIQIGQVIRNDELTRIFKCGNMGGMRRSKKTNTLVIISDITKGLYNDHREGNIYFYTGMGKTGNMDLLYAQNRTVLESNKNGIEMHMFEVLSKGNYTYLGRVVLHDEPYKEEQFDINNSLRKVWIFPLRIVEHIVG